MIRKVFLCIASEKGKYIIDKYIDQNIYINPIILQRLLIIVHGNMLKKYNKPFFSQKVIARKYGLSINEVDDDFIIYSDGFKDKLIKLIPLLDIEKKIIDDVFNKYKKLSSMELNDLKELKTLYELCYSENSINFVPNDLIKYVFTHINDDNLKTMKQDFQKVLKNNNFLSINEINKNKF